MKYKWSTALEPGDADSGAQASGLLKAVPRRRCSMTSMQGAVTSGCMSQATCGPPSASTTLVSADSALQHDGE